MCRITQTLLAELNKKTEDWFWSNLEPIKFEGDLDLDTKKIRFPYLILQHALAEACVLCVLLYKLE